MVVYMSLHFVLMNLQWRSKIACSRMRGGTPLEWQIELIAIYTLYAVPKQGMNATLLS